MLIYKGLCNKIWKYYDLINTSNHFEPIKARNISKILTLKMADFVDDLTVAQNLFQACFGFTHLTRYS